MYGSMYNIEGFCVCVCVCFSEVIIDRIACIKTYVCVYTLSMITLTTHAHTETHRYTHIGKYVYNNTEAMSLITTYTVYRAIVLIPECILYIV